MLVRRAGLALISVPVLVGLALPAGSGAAAKPDEICGTLPGDGAYGYVKVWNMSCDRAYEVSNKVADDFCDPPGRCSTPPDGGYVRGRENYRGWECKLTLAYEFYRARCERNDNRFVHESAA